MTNALFLWQRKIDLCMAFRFVYLLNTQLPMIIETDNKNFAHRFYRFEPSNRHSKMPRRSSIFNGKEFGLEVVRNFGWVMAIM